MDSSSACFRSSRACSFSSCNFLAALAACTSLASRSFRSPRVSFLLLDLDEDSSFLREDERSSLGVAAAAIMAELTSASCSSTSRLLVREL